MNWPLVMDAFLNCDGLPDIGNPFSFRAREHSGGHDALLNGSASIDHPIDCAMRYDYREFRNVGVSGPVVIREGD